MRIIEEIAHPACKITIFNFNGKYLVKFETPQLEQTYKISEHDVNGLLDIKKIINHDFITKVYKRFLEMNKDFKEEIEKK